MKREYVEVDIVISGCVTVTVPFYEEEECWKRGRDEQEYLNVAEKTAIERMAKCKGLENVEIEKRITGRVVTKTNL